MESPWKFFARLVSPRRQQKPGDGPFEEEKPNVSPIAAPREPSAKADITLADQPIGENAPPAVPSAPVSAEPQPLAGIDSDGQVREVSDNNEDAQTSHPAKPDIGATRVYVAPKAEAIVRAAPDKRKGRARETKAVDDTQASAVVPAKSDEISLDEEIRVLRGKLASKLRLQNKQLKKMLERFDR